MAGKEYMAVAWGGTVRHAGKQETERKAKIYCFGIATDDMVVHRLGTRKEAARKKIVQISSEVFSNHKEDEMSKMSNLHLQLSELRKEVADQVVQADKIHDAMLDGRIGIVLSTASSIQHALTEVVVEMDNLLK